MIINGEEPIQYFYDAASRLIQVVQGAQNIDLTYDSAGRKTGMAYPNGTNALLGYDPSSRLTTLTHQSPSGVFEDLTYTYDAAGNRTSFSRSNGNATILPESVQAAYDAVNQQIQFNSTSSNLIYDANGSLISENDQNGTTTYTWDARNRLVAINGPNLTTSFTYDALGRRIRKTINAVTNQFLHDGRNIIAEFTNNSLSATYLGSLEIDKPWVRQSATGNEYYHSDAQGTILALTNQSGAIKDVYSYDAFGKTTTTGTSLNDFKFTGREHDVDDLYYYRARYYSTAFNRFLSEDPLFSARSPLDPLGPATVVVPPACPKRSLQEMNLYLYVANNPLKFIDPLGLEKKDCKQDCEMTYASCVSSVNTGNTVCTVVCVGGAVVTGQVGVGIGCAVVCSVFFSTQESQCAENRNFCSSGCL